MREWWEKEQAFEDAFRAGRVTKNIWRYIPAWITCHVAAAYVDSDGYWRFLEDELTAYDGGGDCSVIHCYTIADLKADLKTVRRREVNT